MASTSFGWKVKQRKILNKSKLNPEAFSEAAQVEEGSVDEDNVDWLHSVPVKKQKLLLEDCELKAKRLKNEGVALAESERYWEAINKWDACLQLVDGDETVLEMKAQALMALNELYPAVSTAKLVVTINPRWWIGWQTNGRALLNIGEVHTAIASFQKAVHINPANKSLWEDDLSWAITLLDDLKNKAKTMTGEELQFHVRECMRIGLT